MTTISTTAPLSLSQRALPGTQPISASMNHMLALTDDGLHVWSNNANGQLVLRNNSDKVTTVKIPGEDNAIVIGASECKSIALH